MKKFTICSVLALFMALSTSLYSQTLLLTPTTPLLIAQSSNLTPIDIHITVENTSSIATNVMIIRYVKNVNDTTPLHSRFFCFGQTCYGPKIDTSTTPGNILAGKDIDFKTTVEPNGICGSDKLHYRFYDPNNIVDSVTIDVEYGFCTAVGINEIKNSYGIINAGNNPANNYALFTYSLPSEDVTDKIVVYNMLGSLVKSMDINGNKGAAVLNTSELKSGMYLVSYVGQNGIKSSSRLIVKH